jgi:cystathionine beta-lyase family protein involved in aluminum resistance
LTQIQRYDVVEDLNGFQLRRYEPHHLVTKPMSGSLATSGNSAFGYLAGYISGQNQSGQKIAMTAPVLQQKTATGFEVSFVMPHDLVSPPQPVGDLKLTGVAGKLMAALQFSGSASDAMFEKKAQQLLGLLAKAAYRPVAEAMFARYNGPWTPPILRRNEVLVEVEPIQAP